ncbi:beta-lactamase family protein [Pendulispora brunnea]|uniref:Beta-lactamase family protein n=1 Tax=Pendulispora brunnea TaxID=2905690 RepID=A0ABZ2KFZ1_9BACT
MTRFEGRSFTGALRIAALAITLFASAACHDAEPRAGSGDANPDELRELDADAAKRLDAGIHRVMHEMGIPGAIIGLWMPAEGAYVRAFGVADEATGAPMTPYLYMRIGSVTKTFSVTALLQLVDQGKIGLDDAISKYVAGVPEGDRITLRHLAGMRSGIRDFGVDADFGKNFVNDPRHIFTAEELLGYGLRHPLSFEPGNGFEYSNTNTVLLGLVIEKVSGQHLDEYLREHVFEPLRLGQTSYPTTSFFPSPHPRAYTSLTPDGRVVDGSDWSLWSAGAAGGVISRLDDMLIWSKALATGRLLTPAMHAERLQGVTLPKNPGVRYGLGLFDAGGWIGHNGSIAGFESLMVYLASRDTPLIILLNTDVRRNGASPALQLAKAITSIATPENPIPL